MAGPSTLPSLRRDMAYWSRKIWDRGYVANHDGNLSCRLPGRKFLCTPTSFSKGEVQESDLLVLDRHGKKLQGRWKPFSELDMHLAAFKARPDFEAVIHAHPPVSTGFTVAGVTVETTLMAEPVVSLGDRIPTLPFSMPKSEEQVERLIQYFQFYDVVLLKNHGVIAGGKDLEQAYLRIELVEHLANIKKQAMQVGQLSHLSEHQVQTLMRKRNSAGLGPDARGVTGHPPSD